MALSTWLILALVAAIVFLYQRRKKFLNFPPGPVWNFPIVGHLPVMGNEPYKTMLEWKKTYGPLIGVQLGSYQAVFINDLKTIKEMFNKHEFSGRADLELFVQATRRKGVAFVDGPITVEQRAFVVKNLKYFANNALENRIMEEITDVLNFFKSQEGKPVYMKDFFHVSILNATWSLFMGQKFERGNTKLKELSEAIHDFCTVDGVLVQLAMLVPFISKHFPEYSGFNRQLRGFLQNYDFMEQAFNEPLPPDRIPGQPRNFKEAWFDQVELAGDDKTSSFHPSHNCFPITAGDIFMSSMETISTSIEWTLLYMVCFPEVQKKLQAEIDDIIGNTRIPVLLDRPKMPYMDAVTLELLRLSTVTPMNGPWRRALEDGEAKGYKIPKGTFLIANVYALHYDLDIWGDPHTFRPERFLNAENKVDKNVSSQVMAFSTGKRSCLGENLARDQLFLYIVSIMQKFDVSCNQKISSIEGTPGMVRYPPSVEIVFTSRFND